MYNFPQYTEEDPGKVLAFMQAHPFVMLIGKSSTGRIECTQIPVLVEERKEKLVILGHMARKTPHEKTFVENPEALVVFTSPHTYVSGTWYTGNLQQASTWNYISVHARGNLSWMNDEQLIELLKKFTLHFENNDPASTTIYDNLPDSYLQPLIRAIRGFEMEITELDNVFKLSQNRDEKSYQNIISHLELQDEAGKFIAEKMKENASRLFNRPGT